MDIQKIWPKVIRLEQAQAEGGSGYANSFCSVDSDGTAGYGFANGSRGVSFGFCV